MKLHPEFEHVGANLKNRDPIPSLDVYLNELLRNEQRGITQTALAQKHGSSPSLDVAYATQTIPRDLRRTQCYSYKGFGHLANQCKRKVCSYCKNGGHIISECRKWPQNRTNRALNTVTDGADGGSSSVTSQPTCYLFQQCYT